MIKTVKDHHTFWCKRMFQANVQISGCTIILFASLLILSILATISMVLQRTFTFNIVGVTGIEKADVLASELAQNVTLTPSAVVGVTGIEKADVLASELAQNVTLTPSAVDTKKVSSQHQHLGRIFAPGIDKETCLSRYESATYRKPSPHQPSPYLLSKLRNYETRHNRCGPFTESYNRTVEELKSGHIISNFSTLTDCKYVVYTTHSGLGNRMLTVASAFLYALLTDRVLLVEFGNATAFLFCEPFPDTTWLLPMDFPLRNQFWNISQENPSTYGNQLKTNIINTSLESSAPPFLYLYLAYNADPNDAQFYCSQNQAQLRKVPWLIVTSNQYFIPYLFLMPSFKQELDKLFPKKGTVFYHLAEYLFQPTNEVWGLITRFYKAYLAKADKRIGIQVRVFDPKATSFHTVMNQIVSCALKRKLLPKVVARKSAASSSDNGTSKAVLVTSLHSEYYEHLKEMYWTKPTKDGQVIGVYQPSHEEYQQYGSNMHSMKAWAEMYLLGLSDVLVTSGMSTFGYVAQGIAGLKPWILSMPPTNGGATKKVRPCGQAMSIDPCFHFPPRINCKEQMHANTDSTHLRPCEDVNWGIKLVD